MTFELLLAAGGEHPPALLDPHGFGLVFWTAIIFGIVALILYKTAWGPLLQALQDREAAITGSIEEARGIKVEAERLRAEYEDKIEKVRQEAQSIIDEGERDGRAVAAKIKKAATVEAAEIRARADKDVDLAKTKALAEVKASAGGLGLLIAERVINAEIDGQKHQTIMDEVIASYGAA